MSIASLASACGLKPIVKMFAFTIDLSGHSNVVWCECKKIIDLSNLCPTNSDFLKQERHAQLKASNIAKEDRGFHLDACSTAWPHAAWYVKDIGRCIILPVPTPWPPRLKPPCQSFPPSFYLHGEWALKNAAAFAAVFCKPQWSNWHWHQDTLSSQCWIWSNQLIWSPWD